MKNIFRQSMAYLHTWVGLVMGWVLYFMFVTGTLGYFDTEIDSWMQPELPLEMATGVQAVNVAQSYLLQQAPDAERWYISLPVDRNVPNLYVFWSFQTESDSSQSISGSALLSTETGDELKGRDTGGGQQLYLMHWSLHYLPEKISDWLVGICTMFMLLAIITGIIIHKKMFKNFFTFRPNKKQRTWLDIHTVFAVMAIPFHLMITYSGLLMFSFTYMGVIVDGTYGWNDESRGIFFSELADDTQLSERADVMAPLMPLSYFVNEVNERLKSVGSEAIYINVYNPGDIHAEVHIEGLSNSPSGSIESFIFDGVDGELLSHDTGEQAVPELVRNTFLSLHEGLFAGTSLRWLYFFSGVMGSAMIATGLVMWTVKRRRKQDAKRNYDFGFRLVECLNIGTIAGLLVGVAVYFWANRLLPLDMANRAAWEVHCLFIAWGVMFVYASLRKPGCAWVEEFTLGAFLFAFLPLLNLLTTDRHLGTTIPAGNWMLAGFDLTVMMFGVVLGVIALKVHEREQENREVKGI